MGSYPQEVQAFGTDEEVPLALGRLKISLGDGPLDELGGGAENDGELGGAEGKANPARRLRISPCINVLNESNKNIYVLQNRKAPMVGAGGGE